MAADAQLVKVLGGRSSIEIAEVGKGTTHPAFDQENIELLMVSVDEPINGWKTATVTFQAKNSDYISALLRPLLEKNPPVVQLRFGLIAGAQHNWRNWEEMVIVSARSSIRADVKSGPLVTVKLCDRLWLLDTVKRAAAHVGAVSSIVENLWRKDAGGSGAVIEPTALAGYTNGTGTWYQGFESSWSFLMRCMLPLARNAAGTSSYRVFVRDNKFRFHCPGYEAPTPKKLRYIQGTSGFDHLVIEDFFTELAGGAGAAGLRRTTYDPVTGKAETLESDVATVVKFAKARPAWVNWEYRHSHVGRNALSAEQARNQQQFAALAGDVFRCTFTSDKCMDILVGDVIEIDLVASGSGSDTHTGLWLVNKAVHTMQEGGLTSRYVATRGDFNTSTAKVAMNPQVAPVSNRSAGFDFVPNHGVNQANADSTAIVRTVTKV